MLIWGYIPAFGWRKNYEKPVRIVDLQATAKIQDFQNTKQERFSFNCSV